jgi:fucose 4-O-acetylase-like acetyltransferase
MGKQREHFWDNAKLGLIFLVVLGHFILPVKDNDPCMKTLCDWIYLFHMPAFVFISGYFSKSYVRKPGKHQKLVGYLALYLLFTVCLWIIAYLMTHKFNWTSLFMTSSAQWYMLAMFFWLLVIPHVANTALPISFSLSLALALLAGAFPACGNFLAMSRVIVFFPVFLLGYHYNGQFFQKSGLGLKCLAGFFLAAVFILLYVYGNQLSAYLPVMYGRLSYKAMGFPVPQGMVIRLSWYLVSALMGVSFLCAIPNRKLRITKLGERTLGIYVAHRLVREIFWNLHLYDYMGSGKVLLATCVLVSVIVLVLTSARVITETLYKLFCLKLPVKHNQAAG